MKGRAAKNGFTFLEVAISLAIIGIVFVSLIALFNTTLGMTDYSDRLTRATFLAQRLMTEMELADDFEPGESDITELEGDYAGYSYKTNVSDLDINGMAIPLVQEVNLTVYFESVLKKHSYNVTTYVTSNPASILEGIIGEAADEEG